MYISFIRLNFFKFSSLRNNFSQLAMKSVWNPHELQIHWRVFMKPMAFFTNDNVTKNDEKHEQNQQKTNQFFHV